jgi:hypothetical protein
MDKSLHIRREEIFPLRGLGGEVVERGVEWWTA